MNSIYFFGRTDTFDGDDEDEEGDDSCKYEVTPPMCMRLRVLGRKGFNTGSSVVKKNRDL